MTGTLAIIFVFGGLIFFHELGHFLAAKLFGMGVKTFSLGFGPSLLKFNHGKTRYQVALLPLGGFVSLVGETDQNDLPDNFTKKESFSLRPAWQRFLVILSGPVFNLFLAWFLCWFLLGTQGREELLPVIQTVKEQSQAEAVGIVSGDVITSINGSPVTRWVDISPLVQQSQGEVLTIGVNRSGQKHELTIRPTKEQTPTIYGDSVDRWVLGIAPAGATQVVHYSFMEAGKQGLIQARDMVVLTWRMMGALFTGAVAADNIGGPIGIGKIIYDQSESGLANVIFIAALISVNLGILNLFPIPILDGGQLLFLTIEMVFRRPVPDFIKEKAVIIGAGLLIGLMVFATFNDIMNFFVQK